MPDDSPKFPNFKYPAARDRAGVVAVAVLAIIRDVLNEPDARQRITETLRFEFGDLERQVISENRNHPEP